MSLTPLVAVGAAVALIATGMFFSNARAAETLSSGLILHTSSFKVAENRASLYWIDNSRLASKYVVDRSEGWTLEGTRFWNVDTGELLDEERYLECATLEPEPKVLMCRTLKMNSKFVCERYFGTPGREVRVPEEDGPGHVLERRTAVLRNGVAVTTRFSRTPFTGCRGRWLPDEVTPAHLVEPMQKADPWFGDQMVVFNGNIFQSEPTRIFVAGRQDPVVLPVSSCFGGTVPSRNPPGGYFGFKNAYLVQGGSAKVHGERYATDPNGCISSRMWGEPWPYQWLHQDGQIEYGILPPVLSIYPKDEQEAMRRYTRDADFIPSAVGFIYWSGHSGSIRDRLYLVKENRYIEIYRGKGMSLHAYALSPNGCRLAFEEYGRSLGDLESGTLKVIDLCPSIRTPSQPSGNH